MVTKHISRFQILMALERGFTLVKLGDEALVYGRGVNNSFGTSLMLRGPRNEVEGYIADVMCS